MDGQADPGATALKGHRRWSFGKVVFDERTLDLLVDGEPVRLERKPLEVMLYLLRHAGEVVTKDELAEAVWPGRILTETVLTRCISMLRQAVRDEARTLIKTVHGYGYKLEAQVRVEASLSTPPSKFDLKSGEHPPLRPQWKLVQRLGCKDRSETWLARHSVTQESRVFKFALDETSLRSLKREITLHRILQQDPSARMLVAKVLEWNLDQPPCFLEREYVSGGNLVDYIASEGGFAVIPVASRVSVVQKIASALATAHSLGIVHTTLKPTNVLVSEDGTIKLCDFGRGTLSNANLSALGVTDDLHDGPSVSTPANLYTAPEVMAGHPTTVRSDIYALGVMLFQLVVGDFQRAPGPGWEFEVEDELLREDIAQSAAGNASRRLGNASDVAERLGNLVARREHLLSQRAATERSEVTRRAFAELKRLRAFALAAAVLTVAALTAGGIAYQARNSAIGSRVAADKARDTAKALSDFLVEDVLSLDSSSGKPKDASYESLLDKAADTVEARLKAQPEARAWVHWHLGRRFYDLGQIEKSVIQFEKAAALSDELSGAAVEPALLATDVLLPIYSDRGRQKDALSIAENLSIQAAATWGHTSLVTSLVRIRIAKVLLEAGEAARASAELRTLIDGIPRAKSESAGRLDLAKFILMLGGTRDTKVAELSREQFAELLVTYANVLLGGYEFDYMDEYEKAVTRLRTAVRSYDRLLGPEHEVTTRARLTLALGLTASGDYREAEEIITSTQRLYETWLPPDHWFHTIPKFFLGKLRLEQDRPRDALALFSQALSSHGLDQRTPRVREDVRFALGRAYSALGRSGEAIDAFRTTLTVFETLRGKRDLGAIRRRIALADALRGTGKISDAHAVLSAVTPDILEPYKATVVMSDFRRTKGLLMWAQGDLVAAKNQLNAALQLLESRLGNDHWRRRRLQDDLLRVSRQAVTETSPDRAGRFQVLQKPRKP